MRNGWNSEEAGWRALLNDLADEPASQPIACQRLSRNLDLYVSDELDGSDVQSRYPDLWAHLQNCARCRAAYVDLRDVLSAEAEGQIVTELPPRTSGLLPPGLPWQLWAQADAPDASPAVLFVFARTYLAGSLRATAAPQAAQRRRLPGYAPPEDQGDTLLLSYIGRAAAGELIVHLYARPDASTPLSRLLIVQTVSEFTLRHASVSWGRHTWGTDLDAEGRGVLGAVPLAALDDHTLGPDAFSLRLE
jgi:hypothetical protein